MYDPRMLGRIKHVHFIGIGGSGMSGIAEVLLNLHYKVSGSDPIESSTTQRLQQLGATIYVNHSTNNIAGADVIVASTAIAEDNPEILAARAQQVPIIPRAEMLAELMRFRHGIAIAGTHGKTTTTSLLTTILARANMAPTFVIGGILNSAGTNAKLGTSHYLVAEADESDGSFLYLNPMMSVITNIDTDHMEYYDNSFTKLKNTFLEFVQKLPFYGLAVVCIDDPIVKELLPQFGRPTMTYGFDKKANIYAYDVRLDGMRSHFKVHRGEGHVDMAIVLNTPGRHNILNALAAIAIATELGVRDLDIIQALSEFQGVGRRFQIHNTGSLGQASNLTLVEDYGHHPREIAATLAAAREVWPDKRITMLFQPHRYTRTQLLFDEFVDVLSCVEQLWLLPIYAASEQPIANITSEKLAEAIASKAANKPRVINDTKQLLPNLTELLENNDILLLQGAGNVGQLAKQIVAASKQTALTA